MTRLQLSPTRIATQELLPLLKQAKSETKDTMHRMLLHNLIQSFDLLIRTR